MPINAPFASPSGLATTDVDDQISSALLATNLVRVLRCRLYAASLSAFTASGSGVGKTLTKSSNGALSVDSVTPSVGDRILYAASSVHAGVYTVTAVGSAGAPWVLTRATDFDDADDVLSNMVVQVTEGTTYGDTSWQLTTNDPITLDSTSLTWASYAPNSSTSLSVASLSTSAGLIVGTDGQVFGGLTLSGGLTLAADSPSALSADADNYNPSGTAVEKRVSTNSSTTRSITGLVAAGTKDVKVLTNLGPGQVVLVHESSSSTAAYRFTAPNAVNLTLAVNESAILLYDTTTSRWRVLAGTAPAENTVTGAKLAANTKLSAIPFFIDGGGSEIADGTLFRYQVPLAGTITGWTAIADASGSISAELRRTTYSNYDAGGTHPASGDKISASAPIAISSATKATDSTLTGWTTAIAAGDILEVYVNSCTTIAWCNIMLNFTPT